MGVFSQQAMLLFGLLEFILYSSGLDLAFDLHERPSNVFYKVKIARNSQCFKLSIIASMCGGPREAEQSQRSSITVFNKSVSPAQRPVWLSACVSAAVHASWQCPHAAQITDHMGHCIPASGTDASLSSCRQRVVYLLWCTSMT